MKLHRLRITLTLTSPFNTAASEPSRLGIDSPLLRDHRGRVCLPGTLVQGRVLEEINNWPGFDALRRHFGAAGDKQTFAPNRKQILFGDLVMDAPNHATTHTFVRISKDDATGATKEGMLQVIEQPAPSGALLTFSGDALIVCDESTADAIRTELEAALRLVPNFGADRSVGFGVLQSASVELQGTPDAPAALSWPERATCVELTLHIDRPFLVTESSPRENLFNGSDIVPGNALKGAFADTLKALGLGEAKDIAGFDNIVFNHAFCAHGNERPRALPESLVEHLHNGCKIALDLANESSTVVLGAGDALAAPLFALDWKDAPAPPHLPRDLHGKVTSLKHHFGWATPAHNLRVRTAIDSETLAAAESQLFAYDQVLHEHPDESQKNGWQPHTWRSRIDISALNEQEQTSARATLITVLKAGLVGLGKTKAHVTVARLTAAAPHSERGDAQQIIVTLQTAALLTRPGLLNENANAAQLHAAYAATFATLSNDGFALSHFYARQSLRGGHYQSTRFRHADAANYAPWLMTSAGSVFVLKIMKPDAAAKVLSEWLQLGLPIPAQWGEQYTSWKTNPYLPQNGFGEIAIDYPEHTNWAPDKRGVAVTRITS